MTEGEKTQTESVEDVDHSSHASVLAERYDPTTFLVHHSLVVDQTNILYRVCQKSDTPVNYVNIASYKLKNTRYLHRLNNFNIHYY